MQHQCDGAIPSSTGLKTMALFKVKQLFYCAVCGWSSMEVGRFFGDLLRVYLCFADRDNPAYTGLYMRGTMMAKEVTSMIKI
jgi:hypothetical protein